VLCDHLPTEHALLSSWNGVVGHLNECECKKKLVLGETILQKNSKLLDPKFDIEFSGTHCLANESQSPGPISLRE